MLNMKFISQITSEFSKINGNFKTFFPIMKLLYSKPDLLSYCGDFIV